MENINFVPEDVQRILSSHEISEKYNKQEVFYKKTALKNVAIFTRKNLCGSLFLVKMKAFKPATLLRNSNTGSLP